MLARASSGESPHAANIEVGTASTSQACADNLFASNAQVSMLPFLFLARHGCRRQARRLKRGSACSRVVLRSHKITVVREPSQRRGAAPASILNGIKRTRPRDWSEGLVQGAKLAGVGAVAGIVAIVGMTASCVGALRKRKVAVALKCLVGGAISGVLAVMVGSFLGLVQFGRGLGNTPNSFRARANCQVWDSSAGAWVDINLPLLESQVAEADEPASPEARASSVVDTELYDLLKAPPAASAREIKRAYYREARLCHPDTNPGDKEATAKFQALAEAYKVLSDPELRAQYDAEGKGAVEATNPLSKMDPTVFFSLLFGYESFEPWVGELDLAMRAGQLGKTRPLRPRARPGQNGRTAASKDMLASVRQSMLGAAKLERRQLLRKVQCASYLRRKLDGRAAGADDEDQEWDQRLRAEAAELARGQRGPDLLLVLGNAYHFLSEAYLSDQLGGRLSVTRFANSLARAKLGLWHRWRTLRDAAAGLLSMRRGIKHVAKSQRKGEDGYSQHRKVHAALEEALPMFIQLAWRTVLTDVDKTAGSITKLVLWDKSVSPEARLRRARALSRLGTIFREEGSRAAGAAEANSAQGQSPADVRATIQQAFAASMAGRQDRQPSAAGAAGQPGTSPGAAAQPGAQPASVDRQPNRARAVD